jgi:YD repeat-containing protein
LSAARYAVSSFGDVTDGLGTHVYEYDKLYRITEADYPGTDVTDYTYDAVGNRKTMVIGAGTTNYAYDAANRLTSPTTVTACATR